MYTVVTLDEWVPQVVDAEFVQPLQSFIVKIKVVRVPVSLCGYTRPLRKDTSLMGAPPHVMSCTFRQLGGVLLEDFQNS